MTERASLRVGENQPGPPDRERRVPGLTPLSLFLVLVAAFIYFFLFQFATKVKSALATENADQLSSGIKSLKTFFIISTILAGVALLNSIINLFL